MSKAAAPIWSGSFFTASISPPSPDRRYTQEDFRIAQILQDEAPKKTFEDDSNDGIMGKTDAGKSIDTPKQSAFSSIPSYLDISDGKVGGKVPIEEYQSIRSRSVKNFDADSITLGKYTDGPDSYISRAGTNSSYFDLGNEWGIIQDKYELTDAEMFDYFNKPALDNAIAGRKTIRFSHNPLDYEGSFLADEWEYIKQQLNKSDKDLSFEGGFWYVK